MESILRDKGEDHIILTVNILWQIWKSRNAICFNDKRKDPLMVVTKQLQNGQNIRKYRKARKKKGKVSKLSKIRTQNGELLNMEGLSSMLILC